MNKTATIMTEAEALALPLKDRPICFRVPSKIYHDVFEHIGEASMCWNPRPSIEVFNSEQASDVAVRLLLKIADELEAVRRESYRQARLDMAKIIHDAMMQRAGISKSSPQITDDEQLILSAPDKP